MLSTSRSALRSIGGCVFAGSIAVASASSCESSADAPPDPERAFVETPGGRRILVAPSASAVASSRIVLDQPYVIAKFGGPISTAARDSLAAAGYQEVGYLPYDALLLERPAGFTADEAAPAIPGVVAWEAYRAGDRVGRDLLPEAVAAHAGQGPVAVMIHVMPGHDRAAVRAAVVARGAEVAGEGDTGAEKPGRFGRLVALFSKETVADDVRALSEHSEIFFLERIHHVGWLNSKTAGTIQSGTQGNAAAQTPIWAQGIRGENQIVALADTGIDANSCYFNGTDLPITNGWSSAGGYATMTDPSHRKIIAYDFLYTCAQWPGGQGCEDPANRTTQWDTQGHGSHVAGNMVGDSNNDPASYAAQDGMAPAAKVVAQDVGYGPANTCADAPGLGCPIISLGPIFEQARLQGASMHNNSWGDNEDAAPPAQCNYSARSADVDLYMWEHRDFLVVFAAGNSGGGNAEFSVGSPSTNKNGLSIGSTRTSNAGTDDDDMSNFSSRGWTSDGRVKPDLMTPGYNTSAGNNGNVGDAVNCGTSGGGGTSYAAPIAVGAAALVRQYFTEGFYPSGARAAADALVPSAALLKAVLINSGVQMNGSDNAGGAITPIPSNEQGWGRIQLDRALFFTGGARKLYVHDQRQGMPAGAMAPITYTVNAVEATQPLKVTLTWTDYPGMPDSPPSSPSVTNSATWNAPRLVNDLDLTVTGPSGTYLGNAFTNGVSSAGGMADRRNNVEQVLLSAPAAGMYTITVRPFSIVQGNQEFALVVTGAWGSVVGPPTVGDAGSDAPPTMDAPPSMPDTGIDSSDSAVADVAPPRPDGSSGAGGSAGTGGGTGTSGSAGTGGAGTGGAGGGGAAGTGGRPPSDASGDVVDAAPMDGGRIDAGRGAGDSSPPIIITDPASEGFCSCKFPRRDERPTAGLLGLALALTHVARRRFRRAS